MPETLTASFCERCGARHDFRTASGLSPLRRTRGFFGGLKNYLVGEDGLGEAMHASLRAQEAVLASAQLDAFHESFHLCIECRQYTCRTCWNEDAGRCRSCAPMPGDEAVQPAFDAIAISAVAAGAAGSTSDVASWPSLDLHEEPSVTRAESDELRFPLASVSMEPPTAELVDATPAEPEGVPPMEEQPERELPVVMAEPPSPAPEGTEEDVEPLVAQLDDSEVGTETYPEPEPEPVIAEAQPARLTVVAWDDDEQPVEGQAEVQAELELEPEPEAQAAFLALDRSSPTETVPQPSAETEEPMLAEAEHRADADDAPAAAMESEAEQVSEPVAKPEAPAAPSAPAPQPRWQRPSEAAQRKLSRLRRADGVLRFPADPAQRSEPERVAAVDESPEAAARRAQLELLGLGDPGEAPLVAERPVLAYRSRGAAAPTDMERSRRTAGAAGPGTSMWEASAREVAEASAQVLVHSCRDCGLALSASARFCRRCGTRQAQSA